MTAGTWHRLEPAMPALRLTVSLLGCVMLAPQMALGSDIVPGLPKVKWAKPGDLNIGCLFAVTYFNEDRKVYTLHPFNSVGLVETVDHIFNIINKEQKILPGIKLGFVILDTRLDPSISVGQSLSFLRKYEGNTTDPQQNKVIGVVGTDTSLTSIPSSTLLATMNIPMVSFLASADILSDMNKFPAFFRVIAPLRYQLAGIIKLLKIKNWLYFSVMYQAGTYGDGAYRALRLRAEKERMCIAMTIKLMDSTKYEQVLNRLKKQVKLSRIVVVLVSDIVFPRLFAAAKATGTEKDFLWIGTDTLTVNMYGDGFIPGSIAVAYDTHPIPGFLEIVRTSLKTSENPWLPYQSEEEKKLNHKELCKMLLPSCLVYDAVLVLAHALSMLLQEKCPTAKGKQASECFDRHQHEFISYIWKVSFKGLSGNIVFNKEGDVIGNVKVIQSNLVPNNGEITPSFIGLYDVGTEKLTLSENITWEHFSFPEAHTQADYFCMPKCKPGEFRVQYMNCCWRCRVCQEYMKVSADGTHCVKCPLLHWPQHDVCVPITPDHMTWNSLIAIVLLILSMTGVILAVVLLVIYVVYRGEFIIKASSIELSIIQLISIMSGYLGVPILLLRPTHWSCVLGICFFTFSFNSLYVAMLIKSVRVYRIFKMSKKQMKLSYTGSLFQVAFFSIFLVFQVVIYFTLIYYFPIDVIVNQPEENLKYTEEVCDISDITLIPFFIFDVVLLCFCSVFAFKTQSLPSTFKESRHVSMCVITTMIMWVAFMPAYFTSTKRLLKFYYIILAILINHTTALCFLFLPRMYALWYMAGKRMDRNKVFGSLGETISTNK
ncbi:metabotropic glutamate receptor 8-like [Physella acuta]|uniref:metabotropic glutamate receptor 8-like n=1 Tax=Physella acuta TaxID=109671 RepID=UPI0027DE8BD3|nr:metabotropic glutamate receptor 8-like [Physella acuta]